MRKLTSALALGLFLLAAHDARAIPVMYSTTGIIAGTGGLTTITVDGVTITYLPAAPATVEATAGNFSPVSLGTLTVTGSGGPIQVLLGITVTQTLPAFGQANFSARITGTPGQDLRLEWTPLFPRVLEGPTLYLTFVPGTPTTIPLSVGVNQLTGSVTIVPEPASVLLLGAGLAGVVGAARRRRKAERGAYAEEARRLIEGEGGED